MTKPNVERIVLQIQLQARNSLDEDEIQTLLQGLREALSTCLEKTAMADLPDYTLKFELKPFQMLIVTFFSASLLEVINCLQTWMIHHKQCNAHVKAQCDHYTLESKLPASMHDIPDWLPFYRHLSL